MRSSFILNHLWSTVNSYFDRVFHNVFLQSILTLTDHRNIVSFLRHKTDLSFIWFFRRQYGMLGTLYTVIRTERITGLWKGLVPVSSLQKMLVNLDNVNKNLKDIKLYCYILLHFFSLYDFYGLFICLLTVFYLIFQSISRTVPGSGVYFCSLHWLQSRFLRFVFCLEIVILYLQGLTLMVDQ